jgi:flagellar basal-body rod protein FlgB
MLVVKALDGLAMRSSAISQNVANANSPSYMPLRVDFEQQLRDAAEKGPDAVRTLSPQFTRMPLVEGNGEMRLDLELASASETALRYAALVDVLGRQMQLSRLAVTGGQ